ncbi:bifunctional 2-polyprenyl-6-hydroxyphenol methylase/3-demethylubiquinol 3-O-methyltransferase UbiG [Mechercharimyces sp. CAU 1602]|uniref:class I SAM-dependent methyltransferase n=1 Tax=Mechercharimyces sp. CAU 1602 TaxID=2973933 RepID=UPI00216209C3|nr:class I SAM-dependent methyltransferase [Mechercharimyces sp. CAU 1602]MCS1351652.1 class I SAM-dependent methyltransferase [Mechercharimyces sp. CAU 1602]
MSCDSRYFVQSDDKVEKFVLPLPKGWWNRRYEYKWAQQFVNDRAVVLDAACGVPHPFKLYVAQHAKKVYACDIQPEISKKETVLTKMRSTYGAEAVSQLPENIFDKIDLREADITALPYQDGQFDTIFCLSVLEHLSIEKVKLSLREFRRTLKDDGLIILTIDVPLLTPEKLLDLMKQEGLTFEGDYSFKKSEDVLLGIPPRRFICFRAVVKKI